METIHKFENAQLGKAPFKFVGAYKMPNKGMLETYPESYYKECGRLQSLITQGGVGVCAFCGHVLVTMCLIESADGETFYVGSDCVCDTGDKGLINTTTRKLNEIKTNARHEKEQQKIDELKKLMDDPEVVNFYSSRPHPHPVRASYGENELDSLKYRYDASGNSGRIAILRQIRKEVFNQ